MSRVQKSQRQALQRSFAADLADINSATLHLLRNTPDLFEVAAASALKSVVASITRELGRATCARLLREVGHG